MRKSLCIIIVFYNPTEQQKRQALSLSKHIQVFVIDNSSDDAILPESSSLKYFALRENKGIAYAQNYGILKAKEVGFTHILFQDQDSSLSYDQITLLFTEYEKIIRIDKQVGAIGPLIINSNTGKEYKNELGIKHTKKVSSIISSGMLVETSTLDKVGLMEEGLFIDNVDHEWCWRARNKGYNIYMTRRAVLKHSVGTKAKQIGNIQIIQSAPIRRYYKFRNNILLLFRNYVPLRWKIRTIGNLIFEFIYSLICFNDYGKGYIRYTLRGIYDALRRKSGAL